MCAKKLEDAADALNSSSPLSTPPPSSGHQIKYTHNPPTLLELTVDSDLGLISCTHNHHTTRCVCALRAAQQCAAALVGQHGSHVSGEFTEQAGTATRVLTWLAVKAVLTVVVLMRPYVHTQAFGM